MSVKKALKRKNEKDEVPAGKQPKIDKPDAKVNENKKGNVQKLLEEKSKSKDISVTALPNKRKKHRNKLASELGIKEKIKQPESKNLTIPHNSLTTKGNEGKKVKKNKKKKHFEKAKVEGVKQDQETKSLNITKKNKKKKKLENKLKNKVITNKQEKENISSSQPNQFIKQKPVEHLSKDKIQNTSDEMRNSLTNQEKSQENKANTTESSTLPKKKRELTARQKHKQLKTNERKKAKRAGTYVKVENEKKVSGSLAVKEKILLPKSAEEMSSNWKKMKSVIAEENASKDQSGMRKQKKPPALKRNPKFGKVEEWRKNNKKIVEKEDKPSSPEIWFDDVDEIFLDRKDRPSEKQKKQTDKEGEEVEQNPLVKPDSFKGVTKVVGMDCEMVGVGDGNENMLARVSIVNQYGEPIYDKFVKPKEKVVDYRTHVSGVRPEDLKNGEEFSDVLKEVADILKGRILVGHAIRNDLQVLYLQHPKKRIRDTSTYKPFRRLFGGRTPGLKKLSAKVLAVSVQEGEHNSIQDAQAAMRLYTMYRKQWEAELTSKRRGNSGKGKNKNS